MKVKKWLAMLLAVVMVLSLAACGTQSSPQTDDTTRVFTDSVGREVEVPAQIDKVALSGPMAQIVLFALCPDKLVGVSNAWSTEAEQYLDEKYFTMPEIGQLYGGKGELNLETLLQSGAPQKNRNAKNKLSASYFILFGICSIVLLLGTILEITFLPHIFQWMIEKIA